MCLCCIVYRVCMYLFYVPWYVDLLCGQCCLSPGVVVYLYNSRVSQDSFFSVIAACTIQKPKCMYTVRNV